MLKISLIAALLGTAGFVSAAAADDMRAQDYGRGGWNSMGDYNPESGVNRYCQPGEFPHSFPNGNGVRCEPVNRDYR